MAADIIYIATNLSAIFDTEALIKYGGLLIMFLIVFASTGLFFCFFLPSGGILFTGGVLTATGVLPYNPLTVCVLLTLASMLGNGMGYWFGRKAGPSLYRRKDSRFFRRQYLETAEEFYRKYRRLALIGAPFLPIIRTFAPVTAGMTRMSFRRFILPAMLGSVLYTVIFVGAGYFIGSRPWLRSWLKYIVVGIIIFITIPIVFRIIKEFRTSKKKEGNKME